MSADTQSSSTENSRYQTRKIRSERFSSPLKLAPVKSFADGLQFSPLISEWDTKYKSICEYRKEDYSKIVVLAADGILEEGKLGEKMDRAEILANKLLSVKDNDVKDIFHVTIKLYTDDAFMYDLVNSSLRNADMSKVHTLGPYCCLLRKYLSKATNQQCLTVYRGCNLTQEDIDEYKRACGSEISWLSFTSTSKCRAVAEMFSRNALFIIQLSGYNSFQSDVSSISIYPDEEEVLLMAGYPFLVDKVECHTTADLKEEKYIIHVSSGAVELRNHCQSSSSDEDNDAD